MELLVVLLGLLSVQLLMPLGTMPFLLVQLVLSILMLLLVLMKLRMLERMLLLMILGTVNKVMPKRTHLHVLIVFQIPCLFLLTVTIENPSSKGICLARTRTGLYPEDEDDRGLVLGADTHSDPRNNWQLKRSLKAASFLGRTLENIGGIQIIASC